MEVEVRLFATLRLGRFKKRTMDLSEGARLLDVLQEANVPDEEVSLPLVNGRYSKLDRRTRRRRGRSARIGRTDPHEGHFERHHGPTTARCHLERAEQLLACPPRGDTISQEARDGRGRNSIWEIAAEWTVILDGASVRSVL